jgi:AcrR family transcriptional regulator
MILAAAVLRFSRNSYEETKLRDVAADVGVDVAYVHRCFGSKEDLFSEALRTAFRPERLLVGEGEELRLNLAQAVTGDPLLPGDAINPLEIMVRSLNSTQAKPLLRRVLLDQFIEPLSAKLEAPALQRAVFVAATLTGIRLFRDELGLAPLFDERGKEYRGLVDALLAACLTAPVASDGQS